MSAYFYKTFKFVTIKNTKKKCMYLVQCKSYICEEFFCIEQRIREIKMTGEKRGRGIAQKRENWRGERNPPPPTACAVKYERALLLPLSPDYNYFSKRRKVCVTHSKVSVTEIQIQRNIQIYIFLVMSVPANSRCFFATTTTTTTHSTQPPPLPLLLTTAITIQA